MYYKQFKLIVPPGVAQTRRLFCLLLCCCGKSASAGCPAPLGCERLAAQGKDQLEAFKLQEESATVNLISKCCHTLMLVDHPFYEGKVMASYCSKDFCSHAHTAVVHWGSDCTRSSDQTHRKQRSCHFVQVITQTLKSKLAQVGRT